MDWRWAAACVQRAGRGHIVSPRAQLVRSTCIRQPKQSQKNDHQSVSYSRYKPTPVTMSAYQPGKHSRLNGGIESQIWLLYVKWFRVSAEQITWDPAHCGFRINRLHSSKFDDHVKRCQLTGQTTIVAMPHGAADP